MANTAWSLLMKLQGDSSSLQSAVQSSERSLQGLGKTTRNIGQGMSNAGRTMSVAITTPILAAGGASLKMASDFETAFAGVEKTLGGDWGQNDINELRQDLRDMAREDIPIAVTELAAIGEAGGALGIAKDTMLEFIETTALLSVTTDLTSDAAATSLGKLNTSLQLSKGEFTALGDALVFLGNRGASTESEILSMAEGFAGTAGLFDLSISKTLGWASALANTGEEAEAGASSMSRFFQETFKHAQAGGAELELMAQLAGTTASSFKQAMDEDISGALERMIVGLGELTQAEQLAALEALGFTDVRITRAILKLTSNTDNLTTSLANAEEGFAGSNAMSEEAAKRFETFASQMQFLKNELVDIGIEFGTMLLPIIREDVIPVIRDALGAVREWVDWFKQLPPEGRKQVVMWAGIAAAMGPVLFIAGKILGTVGSIVSTAGRIGGAIGGLGRAAGGGQGALSRIAAQPVFVTNWPPGMMAPGGGANPLAPTTAAGRGFLGSVKAGLMAGMKWVGGPLAAVFAGWQIGQAINEPKIAPARDFMTGEVDRILQQYANNPEKLDAAIQAVRDGLDPDNFAEGVALGLDVNGVRTTLEEQLAKLEAARAAIDNNTTKAEEAASFDRALLENHGGKLDKLATNEVIEALGRTTEMGLAGVGTSFQVGLQTGLDPVGDVATRILARAEDPKAPAVMNEIQGHIAGLEEIQAQYLAQGDIPLAQKVQANIDTLNRLIGKEDESRAVTQALAAQAASSDAAMLNTARVQTERISSGLGDVSTRVSWVSDGMGGVRREIQLLHGTLAAKNFSPVIYNTITGTGGNVNGPRPVAFHEGAWSTGPRGGLAMLHDEEMVLPKGDAKAFRSGDFWDAIGGGGRGGATYEKGSIVVNNPKAETPSRSLIRVHRREAALGLRS